MTLTPFEVAAAQNIAALLLCNSLAVEVRSAEFKRTLHLMIDKLLLAGWPRNDAVAHSAAFGNAIIDALDAAHQRQVH